MIRDLRTDMESILKELNDEPAMGQPSGIQSLDDAILGFKPGELIVVGGRPGMGKSSLARDIALSIGSPERGRDTVLLCSLEMSCEEVVELLAANLAEIDFYNYKRGNCTDSVKSQFDKACARLSSYNIIVNDDSYLTPNIIRKVLSELNQQETIACVVIDYLQLMSLRRQVESRQVEVATISRELKQVAKKFEVPVIALSQLNRNVDSRESARPRMSDLRESGAMEQDADKVILIHRPSYFDKLVNRDAEDTGEAELIVEKTRKGPGKIVECAWIAEWMSFKDKPEDIF